MARRAGRPASGVYQSTYLGVLNLDTEGAQDMILVGVGIYLQQKDYRAKHIEHKHED